MSRASKCFWRILAMGLLGFGVFILLLIGVMVVSVVVSFLTLKTTRGSAKDFFSIPSIQGSLDSLKTASPIEYWHKPGFLGGWEVRLVTSMPPEAVAQGWEAHPDWTIYVGVWGDNPPRHVRSVIEETPVGSGRWSSQCWYASGTSDGINTTFVYDPQSGQLWGYLFRPRH